MWTCTTTLAMCPFDILFSHHFTDGETEVVYSCELQGTQNILV